MATISGEVTPASRVNRRAREGLLAFCLWLLASQGELLGWNPNVDGSNPGVTIKWSAQPVPFRINPSTAHGNVSQGTVSAAEAVRAAFRSWASVPTAQLVFRDDGESTLTNAGREEGVNLVSFVENGFAYNGALAVTPYSYDTDSGQLVHATILFNPAVGFSTSDAAGSFDVQAIATHEIGHFIGLDHTGVLAATMLPFACKNALGGRFLSADDIAGVSTLYPTESFRASAATLTGRVTRARTGEGVFGAHVMAVTPAGIVQATGFSGTNGAFRIPGLIAGFYSLLVEPLDGPVLPQHLASPFYARTLTPFVSDFPTLSHQGGATLPVASGNSIAGLVLGVGDGAGALNLRTIAVLPPGGGAATPMACATEAVIALDGQELILTGQGLSESMAVSISGSGVTAGPPRLATLAGGQQGFRMTLSVAADATPGPRNVMAQSAGQLSLLAGGLVVTATRGGLGPQLTLSTSSAPAGAGPLVMTLRADRPLAGAPLLSIDRPGDGNDVVERLLTPTGDPAVYTTVYIVLQADGSRILDGECRATVTGARDVSGLETSSIAGSRFTIDTSRPGAVLSYGKSAQAVGPGALVVTATFTKPLAGPPAIAIDRPGTGNDVTSARMRLSASGGLAYTFEYDVLAATDDGRIQDGQAVVLLSEVLDLAGNPGQPTANNSFTIDTTPPEAALEVGNGAIATGVGAVTVVLQASEPLAAAPLLTVDRPGTGNDLDRIGMQGSGNRWSLTYLVLPQDGRFLFDGRATATVSGLADQAGNVRATVSIAFDVDTVPPSVTYQFSQPPEHVGAGLLEILAQFSESLPTPPTLSVERPGGGNNLPPTFMTRGLDASQWIVSYQVSRQDGVTVRDGIGTVRLAGAADRAGNAALPPAGGVLLFVTGPLPSVATLGTAERAGAGPFAVTATFNFPPPSSPPFVSRRTAAGSLGGSPVPMTASDNPLRWTAVVNIPAADGATHFDGIQSLFVTLPDQTPVTTLGGRFRTVTTDSSGTSHVEMKLSRGLTVLSIPIRAEAQSPGATFTASDLMRVSGATLVARSRPAPIAGPACFEVYTPGPGHVPFPIEGNRAYLVTLPAPVLVRLHGTAWPESQCSVNLGLGTNLISLPLGSPAGYSAADLARDTGVRLVARTRRNGSSLSYEPYLESTSPSFSVELEEGLLLLHPLGARVTLPKAAP